MSDEPTIAGHLELRRRIDRDAQGVVHLAHDTRLRRDVAVELVALDDSESRDRVERDAQAMAELSHPNVVAVHEVGSYEDGIYIAMDHVEGSTLRAWQRDRPWREIVAAYAQAARGLHAAHLAGLVHREFAADKVLVDREPERPHGIGRVRVGDFVRAGEGPLADQLAFGAALHEALYAGRPTRRVPAWLRKLALRTLQSHPRDRFRDLGGVADALERGMSRAARRRVLVVAAALACIGTGVGLAVGARVGATPPPECGERAVARVWHPERAQALRDAFARTQSPIHATMAEDVTARLDRWATRWAELRVEGCRAEREGEGSQRLHARRTACLERDLAATDAVVARLLAADRETVAHAIDLVARHATRDACGDDERLLAAVSPPAEPELALQVESARQRLAETDAELVLGHPRDAVVLARDVAESAAAAEFVPLRAEARLSLGKALLAMHDLSASEAALETALHDAMATGHDEVVAAATTQLGCDVGMLDGAIDRARRWVLIAEAAHRRIETSAPADLELVRCRAAMHHGAGEYAAATDLLRATIAALDPDLDPLEPALLHDWLGSVLIAMGQPAAAKLELERADELVRAARGVAHPQALTIRGHLSQALLDLDDHGAALALSLQALEGVIAVYGPESAAVLNPYNNVAIALVGTGADARAMAYLERSIAIGRKHPDHARTTMMLVTNLANRHSQRHEDAESLALAREAVALSESAWGPEHDQTATTRAALAGALASTGQLAEALAEYDRAIATFDAALGPGNRKSGVLHLNLAMTTKLAPLRDLAPHLDAADRYAIASGDRVIGGVVAAIRADQLRERGDHLGARTLQRKAVQLLDGVDAVQHRVALWFLATDELELGDPAAAFGAFERARALAEAAGDERGQAVNALGMANAAWAQGERERARQLASEALRHYRARDDAGGVAVIEQWHRTHR